MDILGFKVLVLFFYLINKREFRRHILFIPHYIILKSVNESVGINVCRKKCIFT